MTMRSACLAFFLALAVPLAGCSPAPSPNPTSPSTVTAREGPGANAATVTGLAPGALGPARFPHEKHATELEIACASCHHETNAKPLTLPHPEYFHDFWIDCAVCHRKQGDPPLEPQACSACHQARDGDATDQTLSAKVVIHKNCWTCHEVGTGAAASAGCKTCH